MSQFLWVVFPYLMLTTFVVGHLYRYHTDQYTWSAKSSEILEKRILKWGSLLFHYGIIFTFFGHVTGLFIPKEVFDALGIDPHLYHIFAVTMGTLVGIPTLVGLLILVYRRMTTPRLILHTSNFDLFVLLLLLAVVLEGMYITVIHSGFLEAYDYRETINPWVRGLLTLKPDANLMVNVPFSFQLHALTVLLLMGLWPFSRLVHFWSLPLIYLTRSYLIYRKAGQKN